MRKERGAVDDDAADDGVERLNCRSIKASLAKDCWSCRNPWSSKKNRKTKTSASR
jgi:hypothetical protein